jgi:hypothetical protein
MYFVTLKQSTIYHYYGSSSTHLDFPQLTRLTTHFGFPGRTVRSGLRIIAQFQDVIHAERDLAPFWKNLRLTEYRLPWAINIWFRQVRMRKPWMTH